MALDVEKIQQRAKEMLLEDLTDELPGVASEIVPEPSRTMQVLGVPSIPEFRDMWRMTRERRAQGLTALPEETVIEDPEYPGALGKFARVAGALQGAILGGAYGASEPEESILGGAWKGFRGKRIVRFRYFIDRVERENNMVIPKRVKIALGLAGDIFLDPIWLIGGPVAKGTRVSRATRLVKHGRMLEAAGETVDWTGRKLRHAVKLVGKDAEIAITWAEQARKGQRALATVARRPAVPREVSARAFEVLAKAGHKAGRSPKMQDIASRVFGVAISPEAQKTSRITLHSGEVVERSFNDFARDMNYLGMFHAKAADDLLGDLNSLAKRGRFTRDRLGKLNDISEMPINTPKQLAARAKVIEKLLPEEAAFVDGWEYIKNTWLSVGREHGVAISEYGAGLAPEAAKKLPRYSPHMRGQLWRRAQRLGYSLKEILGGEAPTAAQMNRVEAFGAKVWRDKYANMLQRKWHASTREVNEIVLNTIKDQAPDLWADLNKVRAWQMGRRTPHPEFLEFFESNPLVTARRYNAAWSRSIGGTEFLDGVKPWGMPIGKVPEGLKKGTWVRVAAKQLDDFAFPRDVGRIIDAHYAAFSNVQEINKIARIYDTVLDFARAQALIPLGGSYHLRNVFGGNLMHGVVHGGTRNPARYRDGMMLSLHHMGMGDKATDLSKLSWKTVHGRTVTGKQMMQLAERNGAFGLGLFGAAIERKTLTDKILPFRINRRAGEFLENVSRVGHFVDRIVKGDDGFKAGRSVAEFFFNYPEIGPLERAIGKRIVFFYAWPRNNFILHARRLLEAPAYDLKSAQLITRSWMSPIATPDKLTPDWIRENIGIPIRKRADGTREYWLLANWLPEAEIFRIAETFRREETRQQAITKIFGNYLNPVLRTPIELLVNRHLYFDRAISEFPGDSMPFLGVRMNKWTAYFFQQVRFLNDLDRINPGNIFGKGRYGRRELTTGAKVLSATIGRVHAVDPYKERLRRSYNHRERTALLRSRHNRAIRNGDHKTADAIRKLLLRHLDTPPY